MNQGCTVFSQLIRFLPDRVFRHCGERYQASCGYEASTAGISIWRWPSPT
jgi:hypothetical protein